MWEGAQALWFQGLAELIWDERLEAGGLSSLSRQLLLPILEGGPEECLKRRVVFGTLRRIVLWGAHFAQQRSNSLSESQW